MTTKENDFIQAKEVAEILGVSPNTVRLWREKDRGPKFTQRGYGRYFYARADVISFGREMGYNV